MLLLDALFASAAFVAPPTEGYTEEAGLLRFDGVCSSI
jgi:hypothetical protein